MLASPSLSRSSLARLLTEAFGAPVGVAAIERPGPWAVLRVATRSADAVVPPTVIVKWLRTDADGFRVDPAQTHTERVALQFAADIAPGMTPRLLGSAEDGAGVLLVLEDLAPRQPLADLIRRDGASGTFEQRLAFARVLGRFHAATAVHAAQFYARRRSARLVTDPAADRVHMLVRSWDERCRRLAVLDVERTAAVDAEAAWVWSAFERPGDLLTMTNGDMAANNFMVDGDDGRIIDFEFAGYQHALIDCAWMHVPGPAWTVVRDPVATLLETTYRAELCRTVTAACDDDLFDTGMAMACVMMALERIGNFAKLDARPAGDPSRLQRVETLAAGAEQAERRSRLPHLSTWLRRTIEALHRRWPDTAIDTSGFAPYTPRP